MGGKTTVDVIVNGRVVKTLLDTVATVSVISRATVDNWDCPSALSETSSMLSARMGKLCHT